MELPQIGKCCDNTSCKQLDFLPLQCKCKKIFCSQHFREHVTTCTLTKNLQVSDLKKIDDLYKCSHPNCKETSIIPLMCEKCKQHFCIIHRHISECFKEDPQIKAAAIQKLNAPIEQFNKAKDILDKQIELNISAVKKKSKNAEMVNKIQLMRIKNKANGLKTIPTTDRLYFNVKHPKSSGCKSSPLFVSKTWTVGRAIDAVADECKVQNKNNQSAALKLRLFKEDGGDIISKLVSDKLEDLIAANLLYNGENLVLEYVDDACLRLT
ncbi:PREDICTED: AN1-type zinc finger protein 1-like [Nicrophorus vespilloides]|uniref:AN1-type zinc finger protein 1-like n=1 Tax=Nicrophorus vespilloides TaxID=110193 RepID=A0ABM1M6G4_NICVS|nr:PREDICTED: AN1-type zinc finger protein 1-like [Nicrophorus vespilloides]